MFQSTYFLTFFKVSQTSVRQCRNQPLKDIVQITDDSDEQLVISENDVRIVGIEDFVDINNASNFDTIKLAANPSNKVNNFNILPLTHISSYSIINTFNTLLLIRTQTINRLTLHINFILDRIPDTNLIQHKENEFKMLD